VQKNKNEQSDNEKFAETRVEMITLGLLVVILAVFLLGNLDEPLAMSLAGIVLLGSGWYQSRRGWHVALTTWLLGVILLFGGMGVRVFLVSILRINWIALGLILVGGLIIWQNLVKRE
jgi:hypothetical protein